MFEPTPDRIPLPADTEKYMRKSLFVAALAIPFLVACDGAVDLSIPEQAGPYGVDLSGTWALQSVNGVLPFALSATATGVGATVSGTSPNVICTFATTPVPPVTSVCFTNTITAGTMTMQYNQAKDWEAYYSYRQEGVNRLGAQTSLVVRDSIRKGKYYSTTDATGLTSISLQTDLPFTGVYGGGRVTDNNTTLTHYGFASSALSVTTAQLWTWKKQ
jgi:hypothetical protein